MDHRRTDRRFEYDRHRGGMGECDEDDRGEIAQMLQDAVELLTRDQVLWIQLENSTRLRWQLFSVVVEDASDI